MFKYVQWGRSGVFIVGVALVFLLLTLNIIPCISRIELKGIHMENTLK